METSPLYGKKIHKSWALHCGFVFIEAPKKTAKLNFFDDLCLQIQNQNNSHKVYHIPLMKYWHAHAYGMQLHTLVCVWHALPRI